MYLTYEEYRGYGGQMGEADFPAAELRARKRIDWLTGGRAGRLAVVPEEVKQAMMSLIRADGAVGAQALAEAPPVASFSADGYAEHYGDTGERIGCLERQAVAEARRLLWGVKDDDGVELLYRGIRQ